VRQSGTLPDDRRVVFLAAGGMSHRFNPYDVILPKAGANPSNITTDENRQWDERILALLLEGKHAEVLGLSAEFRRRRQSGRPLGALPEHGQRPGRRSVYDPGPVVREYEAALGTGQANVWFDLDG